ncbi:hypothetical protein BBJ28_00004038 [Nothophytophthora sp. Chile5]|nr:hypothetical protein BBJ28_00004038 [Nothophytophthora sp. Chile5]
MDVCTIVAEFVIPELGEAISEALGAVVDVIKELRENEQICRRVYERMKFVNEELYKITDEAELKNSRVLFMYGTTIFNFLKFLEKQAKKGLIKRLASNRKVVEAIHDFHQDMDDLFRLLNIANMNEMARRKQEWEEDRKKINQKMEQILSNGQTIHAEIQNAGNSLTEGLAMIKYELDYKRAQNDPEQVRLMTRAFGRVVAASKTKVPAIPEWFISSDDVDFDAKEFFDCGSYGSVHRGTWGKGTKVVVKCLLMDDAKAMKSFFKEVEVWHILNNPHVIRLYGACHVSTPAFFVCDDAINGNFSAYFEKDKSEIWRLFYEAALGLDYLHREKVVHGDLKCNNILVGSDGKAKICDFGFSFIRSQSVGLSAKAQTDTIRWKAPECLMQVGDAAPDASLNPRFASDVFSFGMCIIEAFSGEPPYGTDDDEAILEKVFDKQPYPRPDGLQDDEWELVQQLTHPNWQERMKISTAIDELKRLADRELATKLANRDCPNCSKAIPVDFMFCGKCGYQMQGAAAASA